MPCASKGDCLVQAICIHTFFCNADTGQMCNPLPEQGTHQKRASSMTSFQTSVKRASSAVHTATLHRTASSVVHAASKLRGKSSEFRKAGHGQHCSAMASPWQTMAGPSWPQAGHVLFSFSKNSEQISIYFCLVGELMTLSASMVLITNLVQRPAACRRLTVPHESCRLRHTFNLIGK